MTRFISTSFSLPIEDTPTDTEPPCGAISKLVTNDKRVVPVDLALRCLRSVPLDKEGNLLQLAGLKSMVEFQSDLSYLKYPPPGYLYPGVDILGELDAIGERLKSDEYGSEYGYQLELHETIAAAHDGHFSYVPDILQVFLFTRLASDRIMSDGTLDPFSLLSVSDDGVQLPSVYGYSDRFALASPAASNYRPSPIVKINGEDVETWLEKLATGNGANQDPDANYNSLFPSIPHLSSRSLSISTLTDNVFTFRLTDGGSTANIHFANGTTRDARTAAILAKPELWVGVEDGESFFRTFCNNTVAQVPSLAGLGPTTKRVPYRATNTTGVPSMSEAYPCPIVIAANGSVAGYFPKAQPDLAVLAIPTYQPADHVEFENVIRQLLATAKHNGKTKLIIDLRGNMGGFLLLASDTFHQLFPSMSPYSTGNYRANDLFDFVGQTVSTAYAEVTEMSYLAWNSSTYFATLPFNVHQGLDGTNGKFDSWQRFYGPHQIYDGNYTSLTWANLSDPSQRGNIDVYGYGNDTAPQPQTFEADNIVLLQDGTCASTCAVFTEFMKTQAHVRQIVVGGRKRHGPMQGVGGAKGSRVMKMDDVSLAIQASYVISTPAQQKYFNETFGDDKTESIIHADKRAIPPPSGSPAATINFRNNIRQGDNTMTPLQFVYEAADCRFFYTAPMYADQELVWDMTYKLAWENGTCVEGSTGHVSAAPWRIGEV